MQKQSILSLAGSICELRTRKIKKTFFTQINTALDRGSIESVISAFYQKGRSATGKPGDDGLLPFKRCLLQTGYGLSDYEVEDRVNDRISFGYFCGLTTDQAAPDHSTLSRFRSAMSKSGGFELLLKEINSQLSRHKIIVKTGVIVDAGVIETPLRPKGKSP